MKVCDVPLSGIMVYCMQKKPLKKVFVLDDDPNVTDIIEFILTKEGFDVFVANQWVKWKAMMKRALPDLMLIDINMPDKSGLAIMKRFQSMGLQIPMVTLTGMDPMVGGIAIASPTEHRILKPFDQSHLIQMVRQLTASS